MPCGGSSAGRLRGWPGRRRVERGAVARQREGVQRRADRGEQRGIDQIGAAPADRADQEMRRRPAHGRGEAAGEREHRDRPARGGAEDAPERREGRIVERGAEARAEHHPDREIGRPDARRTTRPQQAERADQRAGGHHHMAAVAVDRPADERRHQAGDQQAEREAAHA